MTIYSISPPLQISVKSKLICIGSWLGISALDHYLKKKKKKPTDGKEAPAINRQCLLAKSSCHLQMATYWDVGSGLSWIKILKRGPGETDQLVKAPVINSDGLSSIPGPTEWKEKTDYWSCLLTSTCAPRQVHTYRERLKKKTKETSKTRKLRKCITMYKFKSGKVEIWYKENDTQYFSKEVIEGKNQRLDNLPYVIREGVSMTSVRRA